MANTLGWKTPPNRVLLAQKDFYFTAGSASPTHKTKRPGNRGASFLPGSTSCKHPEKNRVPLIGRSDWIRTSDLLVPNETRYQAALRSEDGAHFTEKLFMHKGLMKIFTLSASGECEEYPRVRKERCFKAPRARGTISAPTVPFGCTYCDTTYRVTLLDAFTRRPWAQLPIGGELKPSHSK